MDVAVGPFTPPNPNGTMETSTNAVRRDDCPGSSPSQKSQPPAEKNKVSHDRVSPPVGPSGATGAWTPVVNEAIQNYCHYLKLRASRELGADLRMKVDASDVVQDTLLDVFLEYERFVGLPQGEFKALLVRMMLNNLRSLCRQYRGSLKRDIGREVSLDRMMTARGAGFEVAVDAASPGEKLVENEDGRRLRDCLDRLPERDRQALIWRGRDDHTFQEIGDRLGCSAVAARKLWLRVTERLRWELADCAR